MRAHGVVPVRRLSLLRPPFRQAGPRELGGFGPVAMENDDQVLLLNTGSVMIPKAEAPSMTHIYIA